MNLLSVENLSKSYGERTLFTGLNFGILKGEKVALVARNGSGKTTLLKILAGLDTCDEGKVTFRKEISVAFLNQEPELNIHQTVLETVLHANNEMTRAIKNYEHCILLQQEKNSPQHNDLLSNAIALMDKSEAWDYEAKVKQILSKLQIFKHDQAISTLSGGQKKRVALAQVLLEEPDLLILDEPTNHLDVEMIEWLEEYLSQRDLSLFIVTHDRYFLDHVCNKIVELDQGILYTYQGNYTYFLEKKEEREFNAGREVDKARNLMRKELEWMRRMPKARGTKSKSRIEAFHDLKDKASVKTNNNELELHVKMSRIGGKIIEMKKVNKSYGDLPVLKGFDYTFKTGERIGIVGKNGVGKTSFLNLITGAEEADSGKINVGETIVFGYYSQSGLQLKEDQRVIEVVKDHIADVIALSDGSKVTASQFLTLFQFPPDMQYTYVSKLSGGEKRRLFLLTVLVKNPNFLILDEPTNDLDLLTLQTLEEFLLHFPGCLLIVSHDRYFMDKLVDHLFVFEGQGLVKDFPGNYREWRSKVDAAAQELLKAEKIRGQSNAAMQPVVNITEAVKKKKTFKEKFEFEQLQDNISSLELQRKALEKKLEDTYAQHQDIMSWSSELAEIIQQINDKELRWLELSEIPD